jgi:hypothetical protein
MRYVGLALALLRLALAERFLATVSWGDRRLAEGELQVIRGCVLKTRYGYGYGSIPINTIFSGMNIHKSSYDLGFTRYQGFDTLPYDSIGFDMMDMW